MALLKSVNNIMKHSQASGVSLTIQCDPERLLLIIHDNGKGFTSGAANPDPNNPDSRQGGFGLIGIS